MQSHHFYCKSSFKPLGAYLIFEVPKGVLIERGAFIKIKVKDTKIQFVLLLFSGFYLKWILEMLKKELDKKIMAPMYIIFAILVIL